MHAMIVRFMCVSLPFLARAHEWRCACAAVFSLTARQPGRPEFQRMVWVVAALASTFRRDFPTPGSCCTLRRGLRELPAVILQETDDLAAQAEIFGILHRCHAGARTRQRHSHIEPQMRLGAVGHQ
jgi:hypothetical protein